MSTGIAESGGMKGSDIIMFDAMTKSLVDSHVLDQNVKPVADDCQSLKLLDSTVGSNLLIAEFTRAIDTKDTQDRPLYVDGLDYQPATRVIAAWGDSDMPTFHGERYARGSLRFFAENVESLESSFRSAMVQEAQGNFTIGASNYSVPSDKDTTYVNFCLSYDELVKQGRLTGTDEKKHIVGVEAFIDESSSRHVHHFLLYGSTYPGGFECEDAPDTELLFIWGPGSQPFQPPPQVGIPLGGPGGYLSFSMEVHYDNSEFRAGIVDNSGVRLYYTSDTRQYDQGVFSLGDPSVDASPQVLSVTGGLTQHSFFCQSDCTQTYFKEEVTVYREVLHMHENGKTMQNQQIRNGEIVRKGAVQYYDFEQQGGFEVIQEPFQVLPGDAFNVVCGFDADVGERWGLASSEEMCITFLFYYPRQVVMFDDENGPVQLQPMCGVGFDDFLPGCEVEHRVTPNFNSFEREDREFGLATTGGICESGSTTNGNTASSGLVVVFPLLISSLAVSLLYLLDFLL